jgi:hypothetical protein
MRRRLCFSERYSKQISKYESPKFYWRRTGRKPDSYDVIDGHQRLRAILEIMSGDYPLPRNANPIDDHSIAGLKYDGLPDELRICLDIYSLDIISTRANWQVCLRNNIAKQKNSMRF